MAVWKNFIKARSPRSTGDTPADSNPVPRCEHDLDTRTAGPPLLPSATLRPPLVAVQRNGTGLDVTVEDDGKGFDVGETMIRASAGKAIGLLGMQERVGMVGGEIEIDSMPGEGTRIHVRLPLTEAA